MKRTMLRESKIKVSVRDINASAWGFVRWALILYKDKDNIRRILIHIEVFTVVHVVHN